MEDYAADLNKILIDRYANKVDVKYIDTDQKGLGYYPKVEMVVRMGYSLPVIFINGEPRIAGGIDHELIQDILDKIL